jgi:hypothetical protein
MNYPQPKHESNKVQSYLHSLTIIAEAKGRTANVLFERNPIPKKRKKPFIWALLKIGRRA